MSPICFAAGYTVLGTVTIAVGLVLLKGREAPLAVAMVCLYICAIVTGGRIWALLLSFYADPAWLAPGLELPDWLAQVRHNCLWTAWPFLALAGHCFICAAGALVRLWAAPRNRLAVALCGATLCLGLVCPAQMFRAWQDWSRNELTRIAEDRSETRRLTDELTRRWIEECPADWQFFFLRANFLNAAGRHAEAQAAATNALRLLPPELPAIRAKLMDDLKRTAGSAAP